MTVLELHNKLTEKFPRSLSCSWDNDGIMVSCDTSAEVKKILFALDATNAVIKYACDNGYDTVITHHPMIFRGFKSLTDGSADGKRILDAIKNKVSIISLHTRMDAGENGVNDALVRAVGFEPDEAFGDDDAPTLGRIANITPMSGEEFARLVKDKLGCASVRVTGDLSCTVTRVGFCGGDGKDFVYPALSSGCNAYITGDSGYNMAEGAADEGLLTIEVGHYHSEAPVFAPLGELIMSLTGIKADLYNSCAYCII